jgi:hypothetical protein
MRTIALKERRLWCSNATLPSARVIPIIVALRNRIEGKAGVYFAYINDNTELYKVLKFIVSKND